MNLKTSLPLLVILLAGLGTSCSTDPAATSETDSVLLPVIPMTDLKDGDFTLRVESRLATTEGIQLPHDPIPSASYEPAKPGEVLLVRFSENGLRVALPGKKISGVVEVSGSTKRVYNLSEGLFAGGSLTVEKSSQGLVSTFTVFGSGEPVLSSERGPLVAVRQNTEIGAADAPIDRSLMELKDGDYAMTAELKLVDKDGIQKPSDEIPPQSYGPTAQNSVLSIRISQKGSEMRVHSSYAATDGREITGRLESSTPRKNVYDLSGLFAGGQFTIEKTGRGMVATFTTFGSGMPVLSSVRGPFVPVKAK